MPTEMSIGGMVGTSVPITSGQIEIPRRLSILVGDVANALRSALDYLVGELALFDSGSRHRSQFPVFSARDDFLCEVANANKRGKGMMAGLKPDRVAWLEELQPFSGTRWTEHLIALSNTDKHTRLVAVAHDYLISGIFRPAGEGGAIDQGQLRAELRITPALVITLPTGMPVLEPLAGRPMPCGSKSTGSGRSFPMAQTRDSRPGTLFGRARPVL